MIKWLLILFSFPIIMNSCVSQDIEFRYFRTQISGKITDEIQKQMKNAKLIFIMNEKLNSCYLLHSYRDSVLTDSNGNFSIMLKVTALKVNFSDQCKFNSGSEFQDTMIINIKSPSFIDRTLIEEINFYLDGKNSEALLNQRSIKNNDIGTVVLKNIK